MSRMRTTRGSGLPKHSSHKKALLKRPLAVVGVGLVCVVILVLLVVKWLGDSDSFLERVIQSKASTERGFVYGDIIVKLKNKPALGSSGLALFSDEVQDILTQAEVYEVEDMIKEDHAAYRDASGAIMAELSIQAMENGVDFSRVKIVRIKDDDGDRTLEVIDLLRQLDEIEYAHVNDIMYLNQSEPISSFAMDMVGAPVPHESGIKGEGIVVGVMDTAVDCSHVALAEHCLRRADGSVVEWNPAAGGEPSMSGHGTHVSGIVASIAPASKIIPAEVCVVMEDSYRTGCPYSNIVPALHFIVENGGNVANGSFASEGSDNESPHEGYEALAEFALGANLVMVFSAGNDGKPYAGSPASLAQEYDNVLAVAAVGPDRSVVRRWPRSSGGSNHGKWVNIAAPGLNISSTLPNNTYGVKSGTSMAAPMVSGVVALLRSIRPDMSSPQVVSMLINRAQPLPPSSLPIEEGGIVNASFLTGQGNPTPFDAQPTQGVYGDACPEGYGSYWDTWSFDEGVCVCNDSSYTRTNIPQELCGSEPGVDITPDLPRLTEHPQPTSTRFNGEGCYIGKNCEYNECNRDKGGDPANCPYCNGGWCEAGICVTCNGN